MLVKNYILIEAVNSISELMAAGVQPDQMRLEAMAELVGVSAKLLAAMAAAKSSYILKKEAARWAN